MHATYVPTVGESDLGMVPAHHRTGEERLAGLALALIAVGPGPPPDVDHWLLRLAEYQPMPGVGGSLLNVQCNTCRCRSVDRVNLESGTRALTGHRAL